MDATFSSHYEKTIALKLQWSMVHMATNKLIRLIRDVNHLSFCNVLKDPFLKLKNNSKYLRNLPYSNGLIKKLI